MIAIKFNSHNYKFWLMITIIIWTLIISGFVMWKYQSEQRQSVELASNVAQAYIYRDIALRRWGASHGGVYVPINERIQPNPLLSHIPERDVTTPSGKQLTLINPAHMLTQIMQDYTELNVPKGKVTAFPEKLLNPQNMPDEWELSALKAFEKGSLTRKELVDIDGTPHFRLMIPLFIKKECLHCHSDQNYQEGNLSGALGVAVPMTPYINAKKESLYYIYLSYGFFWFSGLIALTYFFIQARLRTQEQKLTESTLLQLNRELENLSFKDALTNIANRRAFDKALDRGWNHARRNQRPLSLIMIDVDFFKFYNDCYGHHKGDECLKTIAQAIARVAKRPNDVVARYGGEEFALLLPDTALEDALYLAETCRKKVISERIDFRLSEVTDIVTLSLGVCTMIPQQKDDPAHLIEAADKALYKAKKMGRNRVETLRTGPDLTVYAGGVN